MPKSKRRRPKAGESGRAAKVDWGASASVGTRRINLVIAVLAAGAALAGVAYWYYGTSTEEERAFLALAAEGHDRLSAVVDKPNHGRGHFTPGQAHDYGDPFPTSGRHDPTWPQPGFYRNAPKPTLIVHALEHGNIVIYYDQPDDQVLETLKGWADLYDGQWDGLLAVPLAGLGESLMLTAWTKQLAMARFDAALAAAFVDAYRGRGPEHPVR